ncbi:MAG: Fic family protein, partial [Propionibacteriaceae bacterium]|nr:Fic family protein [Propionibacteriaceae bacterium]
MSTHLAVPAVGYEEHIWVAESDGRSGRARRAAASGPYRSVVPARIRDYSPALPADVAADLEEAASALAQFGTYAASVLGSSGLMLAPMGAILLRTESSSSSQIEQLTVGARQLALAEISQSTSDNATTVIGNVRAMETALRIPVPITQESILAIHRALLSHQSGWEAHAGHYREQLVWVGRSGLGPRAASHVAPQHQLIHDAMSDLTAFLSRVDLPTLLQVAVSHAQFETIHPFVDGNGRTGRALIHATLKASSLVTAMPVPLSAGLLTDTEGYFEALTAYRQGDALPIVQRFTDASRFAATSSRDLIERLATQLDQDSKLLTDLRPQANAWRVLPWLVAHPVINARLLTTELGLTDVAAQRALSQLT